MTEDALKVIANIQKTLECPICLELLTEPCKTPCLHQFCKECIYTFLSSNKKPMCPLCKEPINKRGIKDDCHLSDIIDSVQELREAINREVGKISTPPRTICNSIEASGTPGIRWHSILHPTPIKPSH